MYLLAVKSFTATTNPVVLRYFFAMIENVFWEMIKIFAYGRVSSVVTGNKAPTTLVFRE